MSTQAEQHLLALALDSELTDTVLAAVAPEDFLGHPTRPMIQAIAAMRAEQRSVDPLTVAERLEAEGHPNSLNYLYELTETIGRAHQRMLDEYAELVRNRAEQSRLMQVLDAARRRAQEQPAHVVANELTSAIQAMQATGDDRVWNMRSAAREFFEELDRRVDAGGELLGLSTGLDALDARINGLRGGDLVIIAGRPSMGKTTLALNIGEHNAKAGETVLMFSMEMAPAALAEKTTASIGSLPLSALRKGLLEDAQWARLASAGSVMGNMPFFIDDRGKLQTTDMRSRAHQIKAQHGLSLMLVDYVGLMTGDGENRQQEITQISRDMKAMAKELDVPIIMLSQLNRSLEQRANKRPVMSDLRESGALEQDADIIWFCYRDEYYDEDSPHKGIAEVITAKQRMGEVGTDYLAWQGALSRFRDLNEPPPPIEHDSQQGPSNPRMRSFDL